MIVADIETDGLKPNLIHCIVAKELDNPTIMKFHSGSQPMFKEWYRDLGSPKIIFHNGLGFDVPVINKLLGPTIDPTNVIDTMVVSKTVSYKKFITHSLAELGKYVGVYKGEFTGPWDRFTKDMLDYCVQDVIVTEAIYSKLARFVNDPSWEKALRLEHDTAIICEDMNRSGFLFNKEKAEMLLEEINHELEDLLTSFKKAFPPQRKEVNRLKYRHKLDGTLHTSVLKGMEKYPDHEIIDDELICYEPVELNPASPKDRIDALWSAGWKPTVKTKGHKKFLKGD